MSIIFTLLRQKCFELNPSDKEIYKEYLFQLEELKTKSADENENKILSSYEQISIKRCLIENTCLSTSCSNYLKGIIIHEFLIEIDTPSENGFVFNPLDSQAVSCLKELSDFLEKLSFYILEEIKILEEKINENISNYPEILNRFYFVVKFIYDAEISSNKNNFLYEKVSLNVNRNLSYSTKDSNLKYITSNLKRKQNKIASNGNENEKMGSNGNSDAEHEKENDEGYFRIEPQYANLGVSLFSVSQINSVKKISKFFFFL